jgi:protein TonB
MKISMSEPTTVPPVPQVTDSKGPASGIVASGWLGAQSTFGTHDERKLGRSFLASLALHGGFLLLALVVFAVTPQSTIDQITEPIRVVYLQQPGPGGGGGGSPAPAPPKKMEIPKPKPPSPTVPPILPPPPVTPPPPPTELRAPVMTNPNITQASGVSSVSLAELGGGGRGTGVGPGRGNGVGPGDGGGFGGGAYQPGAGINNPTLVRKVEPKYTPDAMRAKIQGEVWIDAVVNADGTVGQINVVRSLDKLYGLDQEAINAARRWLFKAGTDRDGKPVAVIVRLELDFRLH